MKKGLLLSVLLSLGIGVQAQFTMSNAPTVDDHITLYVIDSMAPNMSNVTGSDAVWDYSPYAGYNGQSREITVFDASVTPNASNYPNSMTALDLEGFLTTYTTDTEEGRQSQGFVFNSTDIGEVVAVFDQDPEQIYTYPFGVGSTVIDDFEGTISFNLGMPMDSPIIGTVKTQVDGKGTLKLAENTYTDVLRYKFTDTMDLNVPLMGDIQIIRNQYEYYDHSVSNLPIFVHATIAISGMEESHIVLSMEDPIIFVGIQENELEKVSIYPNPTESELNIQLPKTIEEASVVMTDALGRVVYNASLNSISNTIDVSSFNHGMYFVKITSGMNSIHRNVVVK